jgi:DNA-binding GntR family transcriptional regulator
MMMSYYAQTTSKTLVEREAQDLEEHAAIIAALEESDGEKAEELMRQHIQTNREELLAVLDAQP